MQRSFILRCLILLFATALLVACGGSGSKSKSSDETDKSDRTEATEESESDETEVSEFTEETEFTEDTDESDDTDTGGAEGVTDEDTFCAGAEGVADLNSKSKALFSEPGTTDVHDDVEELLNDQDSAFADMLDGSDGSLHDDIQGVFDFNVDGFDYADSQSAMTVDEYKKAITDFFTDHSDDATKFATASQRINTVTEDLCGVSFIQT